MAVKPGQLAVVSTPIGNLGDLSPRAAEILEKADILACEDTRMTRKLLALSGRQTTAKFMPYHDHNGHSMRPKLFAAMADGSNVALVSDAGTPLVSDPGYKLVAEAHERGFSVTAIPGPSAVLAGLACAGLPSDRFLFAGFLPPKSAARRSVLAELADTPATLVFYEAPGRVADTLADMAAVLGDRQGCLARELTKRFEEYRRGPLSQLAAGAAADPPRGECVILTGPPAADAGEAADLDALLLAALARDSVRDAAAAVAEATGQPRRKIYARALELAKQGGND